MAHPPFTHPFAPLFPSPHSPRKAPAPYADEVAAYEAETAARRAHPLPRLPTTPRAHPTHPPHPLLAYVPGAATAASPRHRSPEPWEAASPAPVPAAAAAAAATGITLGWPSGGLAPGALLPPASLLATGGGVGGPHGPQPCASASSSDGEDGTDVASSPLARAAAAAFGGRGGYDGDGGGAMPARPRAIAATTAPTAPTPPPAASLAIDWGLAGPVLASGACQSIARRLSTAALLYEAPGSGGGNVAAEAWRGEAGLLLADPAEWGAGGAGAKADTPPPAPADPRNLSLDSTVTTVGGDAGLRAYLRAGMGGAGPATTTAAAQPTAHPPPSAAVMDAAAALGLGSVAVPPEEVRARLVELEQWVESMAPGILGGGGV